MVRSRLSRRIEKKTKKNFALSVLGIIIIIILVFKFGIPLLVNLSLLLSGSQDKQGIKVQEPFFVAPPVLDSFPQATSSANIIISGAASKGQTINLYINDALIDTAETDSNGKFLFRESINPGENIIKTKVVVNEKESAFSNIITTILKNAPPFLKINSPSDNQSFSKDQNVIDVKGVTDSEVKVTINGLWAITDSQGNFSYRLSLQNGENKIKVQAEDTAGNKTEREIKVTYSP